MGIKEAIAEFKRAQAKPERFDVFALGHRIGTATDWANSADDSVYTYLYNFYPNSPTGIFPIGDIVIDWEEGLVYMFDGKEGDVIIEYDDNAVNLIEAIAKEL